MNTEAMLSSDEKLYDWKPIKAPEPIEVEINEIGVSRFRNWKQDQLDRDDVLDKSLDAAIEDAEIEDACAEGMSPFGRKLFEGMMRDHRCRHGGSCSGPDHDDPPLTHFGGQG